MDEIEQASLLRNRHAPGGEGTRRFLDDEEVWHCPRQGGEAGGQTSVSAGWLGAPTAGRGRRLGSVPTGFLRGTLPREKTNVERGKESNYQDRADNQHSHRRSIKKACPGLDRRLDDMSNFLVHESLPEQWE
jgi:hypothetical protein